MKTISIITVNYNHKNGLENTIKSVVSQTCDSFEFIIIDGGSVDGSVDVIKKYAAKIDFWVSEKDKGIYHAMNKGIEHAKGEFCLFLNSGDILHDNNVLNYICQHHLLDRDVVIGAIQRVPSGYIKKVEIREPYVLADFWLENPIPHQSTFIRRILFNECRYDESLKIASDLKFFVQVMIFKRCSYKSIDCIVSDFEEGGLSSQKSAHDECRSIFKDLLPEYIYDDYVRVFNRKYESFFIELRLYKYRAIIYTLSVLIVRLFSLFRKNAAFARSFPLFDKNKNI